MYLSSLSWSIALTGSNDNWFGLLIVVSKWLTVYIVHFLDKKVPVLVSQGIFAVLFSLTRIFHVEGFSYETVQKLVDFNGLFEYLMAVEIEKVG